MAMVSPAVPWVLAMGTFIRTSASKAAVTSGHDVMALPSGISTRSKSRLLRYFRVPPASSTAWVNPASLKAPRALAME